MARITVEDCLKNVKNRFELVLIAAKRARQLGRGTADPMVPWDNDKPTVVALREIAAGYTHFDQTAQPEETIAEITITTETIKIESDDESGGDAKAGDANASNAQQE